MCVCAECRFTSAMWTVNSTPMPTEAISMTTGMALSLMPIRPMMPNSSMVIMANINTCEGRWGDAVKMRSLQRQRIMKKQVISQTEMSRHVTWTCESFCLFTSHSLWPCAPHGIKLPTLGLKPSSKTFSFWVCSLSQNHSNMHVSPFLENNDFLFLIR